MAGLIAQTKSINTFTALLKNMNTMTTTATKKTTYTLWSFFDFDNNQQRYVYSLCMQYGWQKTHKVTGKQVADLSAIDSWLRGKHKIGQSPVKKSFDTMSKTELSRVIVALENMVEKTHKS